jgi:uncharacterized membrane protein YhaH (DUF805 family)
MNYYIKAIKMYANFKGRATRSEFWYFTLFASIILICLVLVDYYVFKTFFFEDIGPLSGVYFIITLIPSLAVSARRLHDINQGGWFLLLNILPIGSIILLVLFTRDSYKNQNKYGPNPKLVASN